MDIAADQLDARGYTLLDEMPHKDLMAFISPYLNKRNGATVSYLAFSFYLLGAIVFLCAFSIIKSHNAACVLYVIGGCVLAYALIPLHEYIHALAYKGSGAREVSYDINLKSFIFLTVAHRFVADRAEFFRVALAPFAIITVLLHLGLLFVNPNGQLFLFGMLMMHTIFCIGDFGLVSYFLSQRGGAVVTYDDKELKCTYFHQQHLR